MDEQQCALHGGIRIKEEKEKKMIYWVFRHQKSIDSQNVCGRRSLTFSLPITNPIKSLTVQIFIF